MREERCDASPPEAQGTHTARLGYLGKDGPRSPKTKNAMKDQHTNIDTTQIADAPLR